MPTDSNSSNSDEHPINRSPSDQADYLKMLGRWARGDIPESGPSGDGERRTSGDNP